MVSFWMHFEKESMVFGNGLEMECEGRRGIYNDSKVLDMSKWKNGVVIN